MMSLSTGLFFKFYLTLFEKLNYHFFFKKKGRLRGLLSFTLLGNAAEDDADAQDSMLWRTTMVRRKTNKKKYFQNFYLFAKRRVSGKDESVARASLRLAGSLLSTKDTVVLRYVCLTMTLSSFFFFENSAVLLRRLIPRRYLRERHVEVGSVAPPQHTITTLLRLFPGQQVRLPVEIQMFL